ncbi:winged helix-turn-helix transcriptional regulator [Granulicatella sp. zg-ZJ]|nr:winged helix-turn-helix transcriptional regulator [Granulicatella sp. zg-ZJ]NEW66147.1 winged helix-turn-helix transcriptional regulator [Granulicatella sp. zg-84]
MKEQILALLENNGRLTYEELAALVGESVDTVKEIVKALEKEGIICGYQALVNWDKTNDHDVSAVIELKVTPQKGSGFDDIAEQIYRYPEVEALYLMSGSYDFLVILRKAPMKSIAKFVNQLAVLDDVVSTATHIVLVRYKDHNKILFQNKKDQRMVVSQ